MTELWVPAPGHEWRYEVSDHGRVRSIIYTNPRVMKTQTDHGGYHRVRLRVDGRNKWFSVHLLVLGAFVGPRPTGLDGCHGDGDKNNNRLTNLRYGTRSQNMLDSVRHGTHVQARKTHCKNNHEFTPENTRIQKGKYRDCKACQAARTGNVPVG